ncbi:hypothetical protein [Streptomyces europaeiscabiei]|uniref:hypothetical protein n=1 Tax=Streptomyces europaeiscabiei TaxID=146819 RepID=UPI0029AA72D6|nr:hypothetical protein [Streptomyces europaeiscabiei]MDX3582519.1 hypothetical protein [Streptomyces europaeiscabiei]
MAATADDRYDTCPRCKWAGKLRKDGTMRKHRVAVDAGRIGSTGSLPQDPHGPVCQGSGEEPWQVGLPEGYEVPKQNEHGGWERGDEADREQARQEAKPRYIVAQLGTGYFAVLDNVTGLYHRVSSSRKHAHDRADELNAATEEPKKDPGPSLDDYAKASRIIQSLIPGVRR